MNGCSLQANDLKEKAVSMSGITLCLAMPLLIQDGPNPKVAVVGTMVRTIGPGTSVSNQHRLLHVRMFIGKGIRTALANYEISCRYENSDQMYFAKLINM